MEEKFQLKEEFIKQAEEISRGAELLPGGVRELAIKLQKSKESGKPIRVKLGMDPTRPDLHLGHTVVMKKLKKFQELGHTIVLLVGGATAMVGDPSGKSETRPALTKEQVEENAKTYFEQMSKVLDTSKAEVVNNADWLHKMQLTDLLKLASNVTVAQMMTRDDFAKRYSEGKPISIHEFFYPLMQAYDSVAIDADIELGGTDQRFSGTFHCKFQASAPGNRHIAVHFQYIIIQRDLDQLLTGTHRLQTHYSRSAQAQIEQAFSSRHCGRNIGSHHCFMLQAGFTCQKKTVVQYDRPIPIAYIFQKKISVSRFKHQDAVSGVFRFDRGFARHLASYGFAEQIPHTFDPGRSVHIARHPLHGPCLYGNVRLAQIADHLTSAHIHLIAEIRVLRAGRRDAQIPEIFHSRKSSAVLQYPNIVVVCKILDLKHNTLLLGINSIISLYFKSARSTT